MFDWFQKRERPPPAAAANPGRGRHVFVALKNSQRSWEETDDLVASLAATLNSLGHKATVNRDWVELESGLRLVPQVVSVAPMDDAGVKTASTIQVSHASLVPRGIFEFQHASGTAVHDSFAMGFKSWAELDLPVYLDALRVEAATCMIAKMEPDRRLVFGPTMQMAQNPRPMPGEDDFCPCCLFTKSIEAFSDLVKDDSFHGLRLFASRSAEGLIETDCRVNGVEHPEGARALVRYAQTWPDRGFEYRKQYVGIHTRAPG